MRERLFTVSHRSSPDPRFYGFSSRPAPLVPYLRMSGRWLGGLGLAIGSKVRVAAEPGRLVLELAEPTAEVAEASAPAAACLSDFVSGNETGPKPPRPRRRRPSRSRRPRAGS
jgi:hypothetical protein